MDCRSDYLTTVKFELLCGPPFTLSLPGVHILTVNFDALGWPTPCDFLLVPPFRVVSSPQAHLASSLVGPLPFGRSLTHDIYIRDNKMPRLIGVYVGHSDCPRQYGGAHTRTTLDPKTSNFFHPYLGAFSLFFLTLLQTVLLRSFCNIRNFRVTHKMLIK
jgi:hypothetical protein